MKSTLVCLGLACLFAVSLAAANCDNPLLDHFTFTTGVLADPASGSDLPYCKTLQGGQTCCNKALVATFQEKAQDVADALSTEVATRDKAIVKTRDEIVPKLQASFLRLQNAMTKIAGANAAMLEAFDLDQITGPLNTLSAELVANAPALKAAFNGFQSSRTTCVLAAFELQAAAWCLACDPNYEDYGITEVAFPTLSDDVQTRIKTACYDFVTGSATQGALLAATIGASAVDALATFMEKMSTGNLDLNELGELLGGLTGEEVPDVTVTPVQVPEVGCSSADDCDWILDNFFTDLKINTDALLLGGEVINMKPELRALKKAKRNLAEDWNPSEDESGVAVEFENDPAGVKTTETPASAGIAKVGVAVVALLAVFFF